MRSKFKSFPTYPRKFHHRDGQTRRVNQPLLKAERQMDGFVRPMARAQSLAEALHCRYLMVDRNVVGILDSPPRKKYFIGEKDHWAYPDFEVTFRPEAIEIHEVKDARRKDDPALQERFEILSEAYAAEGKTYRYVFSDVCYHKQRRYNVELILRGRAHPGSEQFLPQVRRLIDDSPYPLTFGQIRQETGIDRLSFMALVCDGHFEFDLFEDFTDATIVRP